MAKRSGTKDDIDPELDGEPAPTTSEAPRAQARDEAHAPPPHEPHAAWADDPPSEGDEEGRRSRVLRFAKRLMDRRELSADTREILGSVLATSDKAKTEAVRMVAREVRSYLDALELKEDLKELLTGYSLEISLSLKPLAERLDKAAPDDQDED